jgi:hypothetical protein
MGRRAILCCNRVKIVLQTMHIIRCGSGRAQPDQQDCTGRTWLRRQRPEWGRSKVDLVTIAVLGVIVISYVVGSLTSSVETEEKLPHRY